VNESGLHSYVGKPKVTTYINGRLQGENPVLRAFAAIREWLAVAAPWWLQNRGVNIALQTDPEVVQRTSSHSSTRTFPCHLFFAIQDSPPPAAEGQLPSSPPVYTAEGTAAAPLAETMETGTVVRVQGTAMQ
jgi:hypothetical protein